MGYAFLWLEAMASALLLVAVVFSFSGRFKKWPTLWPFLTVLLISAPAIAATAFAGYLFFENVHPQWLFPYTLLWTLLFIAGSWILIRRGRRKSGEMLSAASWSRSKIAGVLIVALALQWSTMTALDNAAKLQATADQTMAIAKARTVLPSAPPYDLNAADLYDKAAISFHPDQYQLLDKDLDRILDSSTNPGFDPQTEPPQKVLKQNKITIDLINEATRRPRLYHPYILDSEYIDFPGITPFKDAARLLALEARSHVRNGHTVAALKNIFTIDKIAEQVYQTPLIANVLIAGSIKNRSKSTLEIILGETSAHAKIKTPLPVKIHNHILKAFKDSMVFEESFITFNWAKTILENQPMELWDFESEYIDGPKDNLQTRMYSYLYRIFLFQYDQVATKTYWEKTHKFIKKPFYDTGNELKEWEENIQDRIDVGLFTARHPTITVLSYFKRVTHQQTQFLLGRLGLAAAVYHSEHGKYPKTLEALTPKYITDIPVDPFSGEPLKMIAVKDGLILYGVGPNLKDDQGAPFEKEDYDWDNTKGDVAFYLGSAYKEHRLKPALEKMKNKERE